jgi:endogenous inhibitor of DNA gyrase (YacG/DUF329 family)
MADLGRWLTGDYRVPVEDPDESPLEGAGSQADDDEPERDN